jgi:putative hemolysin
VPGWEANEYVLLACLLPLICASGFFSGSETALFGMTVAQRLQLRRTATLGARAADALLRNERMLLITILLGNMTVNVVYFVIGSILLMRAGSHLAELAVGVGTLLVIILFGEVLPKMVANARRVQAARVVGTPLLAIHRAITPIRVALNTVVVTPLNRLTAPVERPPRLAASELEALLDLSSGQGVIDPDEQRQIRDVFDLSRRRVREVMTPRVRLEAVPRDASSHAIVERIRAAQRTRLPVYEGDLDTIAGILHCKRFLADPRPGVAIASEHLSPPHFVPEMITLEQLLAHFRRAHVQSAIVVDEYGGTAGLVSIEDVVEEVVGDIAHPHEEATPAARLVGLNRWEVDGDYGVHEWAEAFGQPLVSPRVATLGGLVVEKLGRAAEVGDTVDLGNVHLTVESVDQARVEKVIVSLRDAGEDTG